MAGQLGGTITGVQSGLCLDVTNASTANGAPVQLWPCTGGGNQKWSLNLAARPHLTDPGRRKTR